MSKQSEAKSAQGYVAKAVPKTCVNCASHRVEVKTFAYPNGYECNKETNRRCALGGFAVKKMGTCNKFTMKPEMEIKI